MLKNKFNNNIAILVHACDRYEFLFNGFAIFFNQFWENKTKANLYFATEVKNVTAGPFVNIHSGTGEWSNRLIKILTDQIKEDYVLYMQEDMWFLKPVDSNLLNEVFKFATERNIDCIKLHSSQVYTTLPTDNYIGGLNIARLDNKSSKFLMSHQITLWKKSFLLQQLKKNEHPWRNERKATKRLKKLNPEIYQIDLFSVNDKISINANKSDAKRSLYYTVSENSMLGDKIVNFFEYLSNSNPEYLKQIKHNYLNKLTHDGKPKPKKEDIFTKVKRWITLLTVAIGIISILY